MEITFSRQEILGIVFTIIAYYMLSRIIKHNEDDGDSFSTFLLWTMLDGICSITNFLSNGESWILSSIFTCGSSMIAFQLFRQGKTKWQTDDSIVTILVLISIIFWIKLGTVNGSMVATFAVLIAGFTQIKESKKVICIKKNIQYLITWIFFLIGSILFFTGEETIANESVVDLFYKKLYPSVDGIVSAFMVVTYLVNIKQILKNKIQNKQLKLF